MLKARQIHMYTCSPVADNKKCSVTRGNRTCVCKASHYQHGLSHTLRMNDTMTTHRKKRMRGEEGVGGAVTLLVTVQGIDCGL